MPACSISFVQTCRCPVRVVNRLPDAFRPEADIFGHAALNVGALPHGQACFPAPSTVQAYSHQTQDEEDQHRINQHGCYHEQYQHRHWRGDDPAQ